MIRKSEKLACAYIALVGEKYDGAFSLKNLLFTAQEIITKANELFGENIRANIFQTITVGRVESSDEKVFVRGSEGSLYEYYRLGSPNEVTPYDVDQFIAKLMPEIHRHIPNGYEFTNNVSNNDLHGQVLSFLNGYFAYVTGLPKITQSISETMSTKEAVWVAAATLTYNEYVRTNSNDVDSYILSQNSIARLASVFNPQRDMSNYSQVAGQMVTHGKNNQQYSYLIAVGNKERRIAAPHEASNTYPEELNLDFVVDTIDGERSVKYLRAFIENQYTNIVKGVKEVVEIQNANVYWPSLEKYNPGITKEMWAEVLRDSTITPAETLSMLKKMLELGGESTCAHLAEVYGNTPGHYNSLGSTFGRRVKDKYNCPDCIDKESDTTDRNRVYVVPFVGRNVKENGNQRYSWKLRDELKEALEDMAAIKEEYILTISADSVVSTDPNFTMDNLGAGDGFKPLDAWFEDIDGKKIKRTRAKNERKISNQTLPRLAFQIYESQLSALSEQEKAEYPTCQYETNGKIYKGIYPTVEEFRKQLNSIEYLTYPCADGSQFVIYAWNIFSTILFVKECLKRFGNEGDKFTLTYCNKADGESEDGAEGVDEEIIPSTANHHSLNTILYGPPGTGKTYNSVNYAVAIIERKDIDVIAAENHDEVLKRYNSYKEQGLIAFTTFHQSYGYEEFIEGIKPVVTYDTTTDGKKDIQYEIMPGTFKRFCEMADPKVKSFDDAWDELVDCAMSQDGKFTFTRRTNSILNAELKDENTFVVTWSGGTFNTLKKERIYEQWAANTYEENTNIRGGKRWMLESIQAVIDTLVKQFGLSANNVATTEKKNRVFIIDEINRGNISKIFGELITLIENTKRLGKAEETTAILPYSGKPFGVPDNVYILGTMNTADRSIAQIDTALRRRFSFVEMMPDTNVLEGIEVEGISIANMLDIINRRIEVLYDREHTIGHAFFTGLRSEPTIEKLAIIFKKSIIPLLQEYFYEDYKKIRLVLGDNRKSEDAQFIIEKAHDYAALFGDVDVGLDDGYRYEINQNAFNNIEAYRSI